MGSSAKLWIFSRVDKKKKSGKTSCWKRSLLKRNRGKRFDKILKRTQILNWNARVSIKVCQQWHFQKSYCNPINEKGILEQTLPDQPSSRLQTCYSGKKQLWFLKVERYSSNIKKIMTNLKTHKETHWFAWLWGSSYLAGYF